MKVSEICKIVNDCDRLRDKLCEALRERVNNPLIVGWLIRIIRDQPTVDISEEKHK